VAVNLVPNYFDNGRLLLDKGLQEFTTADPSGRAV
jgi:hypothetical protein